MARRQVTIHYRRLYRHGQIQFAEPLSAVIGKALMHKDDRGLFVEKVVRRGWRAQIDGRVFVLNGVFPAQSGTIFGELLSYDPNAQIPLLMHGAEDASELEIQHAPKPNNADLLRGALFFLITGDHLIFIDQDLTPAALEGYVRWMLATETPTIKDERIQFVPSILLDNDAEPLKKVKVIKLEPHPHGNNLLDGATEVDNGETTSPANIIEILRAAHFDTAVLSRLQKEENLAVKLKLSVEFKRGRNQASLDASDVIPLLRNIDEEDLIVIGEAAMKRRGKVERPNVSEFVERKENGFFERKAAWQALERAMKTYRENGFLA